jgi:GAF domain-containing protein
MPRAIFELESGADAARRARRLTRQTVGAWTLGEVSLEAELIATELVTNAVLHGAPPISLEFVHAEGVLRVAVADSSLMPPVLGRPAADAMTGRGLGLVASLASDWGVAPAANLGRGKVVWADLVLEAAPGRDAAEGNGAAGPADTDIEALLDRWDDDGFGDLERHAVVLGDVPTDLLLSAKAHVENVIRELALASSKSASGNALAAPAQLAELLRDVVTNFAEVRQSIKRQALAAAERGEDRVSLRLVLPLKMAEAGERYLAALDQIDEYARAARMLTVESPPEHRAFRRWYVQGIIEELRAASRGESTAGPMSFERFLLAEVSTIARAHRLSDRAARLQRVTAALAGAEGAADVARVAVSECLATFGSEAGALLLPDANGALEVAGEVGRAGAVEASSRLPDGTPTPALTAMRTGKAVWIENQVEAGRYPTLAETAPGIAARCAVPLVVTGDVIGVLVLVFSSPQLFGTDDRVFLEALAAETAQTLTRTRLRDEQLQLTDWLARLQAVTAELATRRDVAGVCAAAVRHSAAAVGAAVVAICVPIADGHDLRIVDAIGGSLAQQQVWHRFPVAGDFPASEAWRTGKLVQVDSISERNRRFPPLAALAGDQHDHTLLCMPLRIQDSAVGVLSLSFAPGRRLSAAELDLVAALADVCAQALGRAQALEAATAVRDRFAFLAEASAQLASSLNYEATLQTVADLAVPRLGDWCGIDVVEHGAIVPIAVAHLDPAKVELAHQLRREYPRSPDASDGISRVIATGESQLVEGVTDEMLVAAAKDDRHLELIRALGVRASLSVPLRARGRVLGALTLVRADDDNPFSADDVALAEDLGRRAGTAVDNARLFREVQSSMHTEAGTSHARLDLALAAADIGSFDWDIATGDLSWDDRMCSIFGVTAAAFDSRIETLLEAVLSDDRPIVDAAIERAVDRVGDFSVEYRIRRPDGIVRWVDTRGRALPDPEGAAVRMLGVAFDSTDVRDARDLVARTLEHMADGFFSLDAEWRFSYVNAAAERILERDRRDLLGRSVWTEFPEAVGSVFGREYRRSVESRRPVAFEQYFPELGKHFEVRAYPTFDGLTVYFTDVSKARQFERERDQLQAASRHARNEAEVARTRLAFIAEVSADITTTLDLPEVCRRLANHAVERLANWVFVYVVDSGQCNRVAAAHRDRQWQRAISELVGTNPVSVDSDTMVGQAARTGQPVLNQRVSPSQVAATYPDTAARALINDMGVAASLVVPMIAGKDVVGVMAFVRSEVGNEFGPDDVQLATTLASRAALAVQNALLYAHQTTVAQALQQAVLPDALPVIPGVQLWARYEPATSGAGVGGDFYDVFRLGSGRIALAVGDAAGHGLQAGALMGQLRNALRAYAVQGHGPAATLQSLSDLFAALEPDAFATVFYAEFDPSTGALAWASAGHPPPLLTFAAGPPRYLEGEPSAPLGVYTTSDSENHTVIAPGGGILMYTDGLIERRTAGIDEGLRDLADMIGAQTVGSNLVDAVVYGMRDEAGFTDDVCVLLVVRSE